jgi:hypothetical protein
MKFDRGPIQSFWSRKYSSRSAAENTSVIGTLPATDTPHAAEWSLRASVVAVHVRGERVAVEVASSRASGPAPFTLLQVR